MKAIIVSTSTLLIIIMSENSLKLLFKSNNFQAETESAIKPDQNNNSMKTLKLTESMKIFNTIMGTPTNREQPRQQLEHKISFNNLHQSETKLKRQESTSKKLHLSMSREFMVKNDSEKQILMSPNRNDFDRDKLRDELAKIELQRLRGQVTRLRFKNSELIFEINQKENIINIQRGNLETQIKSKNALVDEFEKKNKKVQEMLNSDSSQQKQQYYNDIIKADLQEITNQCLELKDKLQNYLKELQDTKSQLKDREKRIRFLEEEKELMAQQNQINVFKVTNMERELKQKTRTITDQMIRIQKLNAFISTQNEKHQREQEEHRKYTGVLERKIDQLKEINREQMSFVLEMEDIVRANAQKQQNMKNYIEIIETESNKLEKQLTENQNSYSQKLYQLKDEIETLRKLLNQRGPNTDHIDNKPMPLQEIEQRIYQEIGTEEREITQEQIKKDLVIKQLNEQNKSLYAEIVDLNEKLYQQTEARKAYQLKHDILKAKTEEVQLTLDEKEKTIVQLNNEIQKLNHSISEYQQSNQQCKQLGTTSSQINLYQNAQISIARILKNNNTHSNSQIVVKFSQISLQFTKFKSKSLSGGLSVTQRRNLLESLRPLGQSIESLQMLL